MGGSWRLTDAHCHLDFMSNMSEVAGDARVRGVGMLACSVTPDGYLRMRETLADAPNVELGLGLHPWWVADGRADARELGLFEELVGEARVVGEVGMDLSPKRVPADSPEAQRRAFGRVARATARASSPTTPKVLSLHSVRAAGEVLDVLEECRCLSRCRCVFHWFSGSSDELARARDAGCWFSVNEMMLSTRRGCEYARQLPLGRLLMETDLPPQEGAPFSAERIEASLRSCVEALAKLRGMDEPALQDQISRNVRALLS